MPFKAGAIVADAEINQSKWNAGLKSMQKTAGVALLAVAATATVAFTKSVKAANEFQIAMGNVNTILDETAVSTQGLTNSLLDLDPRLGDTTDLTNGLYQAFSAGAEDADEAMQITIDSAKFAKAALTDTATAVDILTTATNAYGKETITTTEAADLYFKTIEKGKITGQELSSVIGQSIPLFASVKIPMNELTAGIAAMTKQGIKASETTTQMNAIINAFLKPGEDMEQLLSQIGAESGSAFLEAEGLTGALELLEDVTGGNASEIATLIPNLRGMKGVMALTGQGADLYSESLEAMATATGAVDEAFGKQELTFETLQNSLGKLQIVVGNIGKAFIDQIAVKLTTATEKVTAFIRSQEGMILVGEIVGKVAGVFNALKTGMQIIVENVGPPLGKLFDALKNAVGQFGEQTDKSSFAADLFAVAINTLSSGITIAASVLEGVIKLIVNLIKVVDAGVSTISSFFKALIGQEDWSVVKENAKSAGEALKLTFTDIGDSAIDIFKTVTGEVNSFSDKTKQTSKEIQDAYKSSYDSTKENIFDTWAVLTTGQENYVNETNQIQNQALQDELNRKLDELAAEEARIAEEQRLAEEAKIADEQRAEEELALANELVDEKLALAETLAAEEQRLIEETKEAQVQAMATIMGAVQTGLGALSSYYSDYYTNHEQQIQADAYEAITALDEQLENQLISEEEYNTAVTLIEDEALQAQNDLAEAAFETNKDLRIANVAIDAASAVMGYWSASAQLGPIAGPIFAGIQTAATVILAAAQIAEIESQQFVPSRAIGGMASGMTRVNEEGGEIISLPDGSQVIPNDISNQIAANSGGNNISISFAGANISDNMSLRKVTNYVLGEVNKQLGKKLRLA